MRLISALSLLVGSLSIALTSAATLPARSNDANSGLAKGQSKNQPWTNWVSTWASMPQLTEPANLPPAPFNGSTAVFVDTSLRQSLKITAGGSSFRLRFSNVFGLNNLDITAVSVARPGNGSVGTTSVDSSTLTAVTFSGNSSFSVPNGAQVVSDPINWPLSDDDTLSITTYLAKGQSGFSITSHPGSRTSTYLLAGNHVNDQDFTGGVRADHWYFISGIEVVANDDGLAAIALVGDSLTDGRGSTTNQNDRWPDQFYERIKTAKKPLSVLNQAAGGNRILADGLGPNALGRIDRDVLAQTGVKYAILFEGVNDIGTAAPNAADQNATVARVISAFEQIATRLHAQRKYAYIATITPFGNNSYDDGYYRENSRLAINSWIRGNTAFDAVLDFDAAVRDPANMTRILPAYDSGDGLHMNPTGYGAIAASIPLDLFCQ
ncbi:hypothetical protein QFC22_002933 [Naganishia vaughanmartiniae]|uniref:Uncharacterized protein n=1 Tax=Naganishia vaughanmartiniae TaxID=1424756 RepID=A0ACC2X8S5_9TREE|nr:hypothetical protein QFC22_002933 [Naganishia vaughanmartiniae]